MPRIIYPQLVEPVSTRPETVSVDRWLQPLSQPIFVRLLPTGAREEEFSPESVSPETTTVDRWLQPFSVPRWVPVWTPKVPAMAWSGFTPSGAATPTGWQTQAVDIVRTKPQTPLPALVRPIWPFPETTTVDRWFSALSQPVFQARGVIVAQQTSSIAPVSVAPETTSLDRWFQPLSTPFPAPRGLLASQQITYVGPISEAPETTTVDRWIQPLSAVPNGTPRLTGQLAATWSTFTPAPLATGTIEWFQHLAVPTRATPRFVSQPASVWSTFTPAAPSGTIEWFQPLSTPIFRPSAVLPAQETAFWWSAFTPATAQVIILAWMVPLSEPVRPRLGLQAPGQLPWSGPLFQPPFVPPPASTGGLFLLVNI